MQTFLTQVQIQLLLSTLTLCVVHTHGSPLTDTNSSTCPRGWYQYEQFCVTQGEGSSDRDIALYCDSYGGIGIKGVCIIKRSSLQTSSNVDQRSTASSERGTQVSSYRGLAFRDLAPQHEGVEIFDNSVEDDDGICPSGWAHYKSLCVYKLRSLTQTCSQVDSVEFHGLCVKHAGTRAVANMDLDDVYSKEKRICCCANFKARGNNYGC